MRGQDVIARSMQLIAGRVAQEYNQRKGWQERSGKIVIMPPPSSVTNTCIAVWSTDLNMVRAGVVNHPGQWKESGFYEIQKPHKRYAIIDLQSLSELSGVADLRDFQRAQGQWVEHGLENGLAVRDDGWSEGIAVGSSAFVEKVKNQLGVKATHRDVIEAYAIYVLREPSEAYAGKFTGG